MTIKDYLWREAAEYMRGLDITPEERRELVAWIQAENSVYDNPWCMTDESGRLMDYITATHMARDLASQYASQED
jgi:hypothetical protein